MNGGRSIDHVVVAVDNLDRAAARYEALGFTLTPRASHPDRMGTANRLAQFAGRNFIELLEVDRPDRLDDHDFAARPRRFSFGAHNRAFVRARNGMSMLVLAGDDGHAAVKQFAAAGLETYAPFEFERKATLPDGTQATLGFCLAFATSPLLPGLAFFVCENRSPQYFWKPAFQSHANGACTIAAVYLAAEDPAAHLSFLTTLTGGTAQPTDGGQRISCGSQELLVLTPTRIREIAGGRPARPDGPHFAGLALASPTAAPGVVPAEDACGIFIEWRRVQE
jgi:catechol 2,3-dioxygenase-like lactoylglutathione lyase family enzyme